MVKGRDKIGSGRLGQGLGSMIYVLSVGHDKFESRSEKGLGKGVVWRGQVRRGDYTLGFGTRWVGACSRRSMVGDGQGRGQGVW